MRKYFALITLMLCAIATNSQNPDYGEKLYFTCKAWGYAKYFHSEISQCKVNWDSILIDNLSHIKNAVTKDEFNDALMMMFDAAGPSETASTPPPEELEPELSFNLDFDWFDDTMLRSDVRDYLNNIKDNFRPGQNCYVVNGGSSGWLDFPKDNPIIDENISVNFPDEFTRLNIIFRYWNIMRYFNPYNNIIEQPWDSVLRKSILYFANITEYPDFVKEVKKMASKLDDAHVEGLTWSSVIYPRTTPPLVLRYMSDAYVAVKSGLQEIAVGDKLLAVDGVATSYIEDSLRKYISAGNSNVYRRFMTRYLLRGDPNSEIELKFSDKDGVVKTLKTTRNMDAADAWFADYYPCDSLKNVKWKRYDNNIGYVNMGILLQSDVINMYNALYDTKALIFDVRNYPQGSISQIMPLIYPTRMPYAKFTLPDVLFPGSFYWSVSYSGNYNNNISYKGKVIVLCNQETQSHAEFTIMGLQAMPDVVVIGSQTAGADGNISRYFLSKDMQVGFTSLGTFYPDGEETQKVGIRIDSLVYPTAEGTRQGRDEVLEKAFEIAYAAVSVSNNAIEFNNIAIVPNPASDFIEIKSGYKIQSLQIYNIFGSIVKQIREFDSSYCKIDVSQLQNGLYFINVNNGNKMITEQFIIMK